jgi:protein O-mannosyl-transferase
MRNKLFDHWITTGICAGLIALIWFVFGQTRSFPFINFDDPEYVYEVPEINSGLSWHNVAWAFTHRPSTNWFPLKNISHMFEFQFFGSNPGAFHLVNVALHTIAALLLFIVLRKMTGSILRSAFVAAIFAIHPLRAESVVWIEERKDVLSGVFFMVTLLMYLLYTRKPSIPRYVTMSILFAAGLLSKPMLVTTPVILLLLDYWPLGRVNDRHAIWRLVTEKIPLFGLSIADAYLSTGGIASAHSAADQLPFLARIGNAIVSYVIYIWQMIWPAKLGVFYPYPQNGYSFWDILIAAAILIVITIAALALRKSRPYLLVGWLWYLSMLAPVIGLIQINLQAHADRYTYLPQVGLLLIVAWGAADFVKTFNVQRSTLNAQFSRANSTLDVGRWTLSVFCAAIVIALTLTARAQVSYWRDSETLWTHTIAVTKDNYFAHGSLADLLMRRGRVNEAIEHSEEALRIRPNNADAQNNLGLALLQTGEPKRAVENLEKALDVDPGHMNAEVNLAWILATAPDASMRDGAKAVQLAEDVIHRAGHPNAIVLRTLAAAYAESGRFNDAIATAQQAIEIARASGNEGLISDLERSIAAFQSNQPIRSGP